MSSLNTSESVTPNTSIFYRFEQFHVCHTVSRVNLVWVMLRSSIHNSEGKILTPRLRVSPIHYKRLDYTQTRPYVWAQRDRPLGRVRGTWVFSEMPLLFSRLSRRETGPYYGTTISSSVFRSLPSGNGRHYRYQHLSYIGCDR